MLGGKDQLLERMKEAKAHKALLDSALKMSQPKKRVAEVGLSLIFLRDMNFPIMSNKQTLYIILPF